MVNWRGVFSVLVTPFNANGEIDWAAFRENVGQGIEDGVSGLVIAGSTGEFYSLTDPERVRLFEEAKAQSRGRVPVIGGCSALRSADTLSLVREAGRIGLDGVMLLPPIFVRPSEAETLKFFREVSQHCDLPIMLYNNPPRTGISVSPKMLQVLAKETRVAALKDSSKDIVHLRNAVHLCKNDLRIFVGFDSLIVAAVANGADGVVSMAAQVFGRMVIHAFDHAVRHEMEQACQLQDHLARLYDVMYAGSASPYAVIKCAMAYRNRPGGSPRAPLLPPDQATCAKIREAVSSVNL